MKILLLSLIGLTASSRPLLVSAASAVWLRTCAVKSGEVDYGDYRHECDDEE